MRYLDSEIITEHRQSNIHQSWEECRHLLELARRAIDALLLIQYAYVLPTKEATEPIRIVQNLAQRWLYESVFSFHASLSLAEQGFYVQSLSINRGLIETLVTVLYFTDKPEEVRRLARLAVKVPNAITLRERFDHVVPEYYNPHYKFASELAHPSIGSFALRVRRNEDGTTVPDMGMPFNIELFSMCLNDSIMLLAGFIKAYALRFKPLLHWKESEHIDFAKRANGEVVMHMYQLIKLKGEENVWHKATRPLWDW